MIIHGITFRRWVCRLSYMTCCQSLYKSLLSWFFSCLYFIWDFLSKSCCSISKKVKWFSSWSLATVSFYSAQNKGQIRAWLCAVAFQYYSISSFRLEKPSDLSSTFPPYRDNSQITSAFAEHVRFRWWWNVAGLHFHTPTYKTQSHLLFPTCQIPPAQSSYDNNGPNENSFYCWLSFAIAIAGLHIHAGGRGLQGSSWDSTYIRVFQIFPPSPAHLANTFWFLLKRVVKN